MSYDRRYARYERVFRAMTVDQAKQMLGLPPGLMPSPAEVAKAYRVKALQNHPDRGGTHEVMVDLNVAKDILEGKRREDARPPVSWGGAEPRKDPAQERKEKGQRDMRVIAEQSEVVQAALRSAITSIDIVAYRNPPSAWLTGEYHNILDLMLDEIEDVHSPSADLQTSKALLHALFGMAHRLAKQAIELEQGAQKLEGTYMSVSRLYESFKKFRSGFGELAVTSRKLMTLIVTSELVPSSWDDFYSPAHQVILSYMEDYQKFGDHQFDAYASKLEKAVKITTDIMSSWKIVTRSDYKDWRTPKDFNDAVSIVRGKSTN